MVHKPKVISLPPAQEIHQCPECSRTLCMLIGLFDQSYHMVWYGIVEHLVAAIACGTGRLEHEDTHIVDLLQGCV